MKAFFSILLLIVSNFFMTMAWYGHLQFKKWNILQYSGLFGIILISWGIAFFEYCFQVPANRLGHNREGGSGPFDAAQLKTIQEVITLVVFCAFSVTYLKEPVKWNYLVGFALMVAAVFFVFRKW